MKNIDLQRLLSEWPDNMPIKLQIRGHNKFAVTDFTADNLIETSLSDRHDEDTDQIIKGAGERFILLDPIMP